MYFVISFQLPKRNPQLFWIPSVWSESFRWRARRPPPPTSWTCRSRSAETRSLRDLRWLGRGLRGDLRGVYCCWRRQRRLQNEEQNDNIIFESKLQLLGTVLKNVIGTGRSKRNGYSYERFQLIFCEEILIECSVWNYYYF